MLSTNRYGKKQVRFLRLNRNTPFHEVHEYNAEILLESPIFTTAFTEGDNTWIVPTESQKNRLYVLSKKYPVDPLEKWVLSVAEDFLHRHPHITAVNLAVDKLPWNRAVNTERQEYHHVFTLGSGIRFSRVRMEREGLITLTSGFRDLKLMKTAQSGFDGYIKDEFTSLKETRDRILCTQLYCEWEYGKDSLSSNIDYNYYFTSIRNLIISLFGGDPKEGIYSASVQHTVYMMGSNVLENFPYLERITFKLPNNHYYLVNFNDFKTDLTNNNEVFHTSDGPHGQIEATFERKKSKL